MGELRQRKKTTRAGTGRSKTDKQPKQHKKKASNNTLYFIILVLYAPFLAIFNPSTLPRLYATFLAPPKCIGTCDLSDGSNTCAINTDRLVYIRVPKTGSTSLLKLAHLQTKATSVIDIGELEDLVASIPFAAAKKNDLGFHDPSLKSQRIRDYYQQASRMILFPPHSSPRTLYQGHLHVFNFTQQAPFVVKNRTTSLLPAWVLRLYNMEYPTKEQLQNIQYLTLLRRPMTRLSSMYYYDRHEARSSAWRKVFVEKYGNATLEECLSSEECIHKNHLERYCNLQTEILCGVTCDADNALSLAKKHLEEMRFFGLLERMDESMQLLTKVFPTYFEFLPEELPREKTSGRRSAPELSEGAQARLDQLCRRDMELYDFANELLTKRIEVCSF
jgi:Sulfotransferase family